MDKSREEKLVQQITDAVNSFGFDSELFCQSMGREHKTLQQNFMREVIVPYIRYAASNNYNTDGRNEETHLLAIELTRALDSSNIGLSYV